MKKIAIIGAGGFGREVKVLVDAINAQNEKFEFIGYWDDSATKRTMINGYPVLGSIDDLNKIDEALCIAIAIGAPATKKMILNRLTSNLISFPNLIHPTVQLSSDAIVLGMGNIITGGCILTCNIQLGNFVILNLMCTVGHDTVIEDYCSFMPGVNISGEVLIREAVYVGTGAKIINQLEIGTNSIVGAGAVVSKSLPENCTAVGIPAKPIKFH